MNTIGKIHEKVCSGAQLSNFEVLYGELFFESLSMQLAQAGPRFAIAASEASRVYYQLHGFRLARELAKMDAGADNKESE